MSAAIKPTEHFEQDPFPPIQKGSAKVAPSQSEFVPPSSRPDLGPSIRIADIGTVAMIGSRDACKARNLTKQAAIVLSRASVETRHKSAGLFMLMQRKCREISDAAAAEAERFVAAEAILKSLPTD